MSELTSIHPSIFYDLSYTGLWGGWSPSQHYQAKAGFQIYILYICKSVFSKINPTQGSNQGLSKYNTLITLRLTWSQHKCVSWERYSGCRHWKDQSCPTFSQLTAWWLLTHSSCFAGHSALWRIIMILLLILLFIIWVHDYCKTRKNTSHLVYAAQLGSLHWFLLCCMCCTLAICAHFFVWSLSGCWCSPEF